MDDVIADLEIGQGDRDAFLDRTQLDAPRRLPEDLAIAQDAQADARDREAALDAPVVDVDEAAAQELLRDPALDRETGAAEHLIEPRGAGGDEPDRLAGRDPSLHAREKELDAAIEVLARTRLEDEIVERAREPIGRFGFDPARDRQAEAGGEDVAEIAQAGIRRAHLGQERFVHLALVGAELARSDGGEQDVLFPRALLVE